MRISAAVFVGLIAIPMSSGAQVSIQQTFRACNYGGGYAPSVAYTFASDQEARSAVQRIMGYTGLPANFEIHAATVPNAAAVIDSGPSGKRRLILYNQTFMDRLTSSAGSDWAAISVLAHEIGHHLSGHTLENGGSRPPSELEADKFSGHVLGRMGASIEQAQEAISRFASAAGSTTHPPRAARLDAIYNGWREAVGQATPAGEPEQPRDQPPPTANVRPNTSASARIQGNWTTGLAQLSISESGGQIMLQESMFAFPVASGRGTMTGRELTAQIVLLATGEQGVVRLTLSEDGQRLEGFVQNALGIRTPLQYMRQQ
jgi:hypothetical protein